MQFRRRIYGVHPAPPAGEPPDPGDETHRAQKADEEHRRHPRLDEAGPVGGRHHDVYSCPYLDELENSEAYQELLQNNG